MTFNIRGSESSTGSAKLIESGIHSSRDAMTIDHSIMSKEMDKIIEEHAATKSTFVFCVGRGHSGFVYEYLRRKMPTSEILALSTTEDHKDPAQIERDRTEAISRLLLDRDRPNPSLEVITGRDFAGGFGAASSEHSGR